MVNSITFNTDGTLTVVATATDGTTVTQVYSTTPVVAPTDVEVDLVLSDGTTKKFVPAA